MYKKNEYGLERKTRKKRAIRCPSDLKLLAIGYTPPLMLLLGGWIVLVIFKPDGKEAWIANMSAVQMLGVATSMTLLLVVFDLTEWFDKHRKDKETKLKLYKPPARFLLWLASCLPKGAEAHIEQVVSDYRIEYHEALQEGNAIRRYTTVWWFYISMLITPLDYAFSRFVSLLGGLGKPE